MASKKGTVISRSSFPMYTVKALDERHFLVAGGGGQAKTGVTNSIEIYEVKLTDDGYEASSVCKYDIGTKAAMNGATGTDGRHHIFAAGLDDECHIYSLKYRVISPSKKEKSTSSTEAVKRKPAKSNGKAEATDSTDFSEHVTKQVTFEVEPLRNVTTDFCGDGAYQKCCQFSPDRKLLATGGGDGHLRVWKTEDLKKLHDMPAYKTEIDDLDISPKGDKIVTISRGDSFSVWNTSDGKKHLDMKWPGESGLHRFRACKFGLIEGSTDKGFNLYTISIPIKRSTKPDPCFVAQWSGETYKPRLVMNAGTEVLSSLAVSKDGIYVAVGMLTGSVAVYISFSLQKLYYVQEAHSIFVTGLEFLPVSESTKAVSDSQDFSLLSISADNTVRLHQEPTRASYNALWLIVGVMVLLVALFWIAAQLGL